MLRPVILLILFFITGNELRAQELFFNVNINAQGAQSVDKRVFNEMKRAITEFLNTRRWTQDNFKPEERIRCNLAINIIKGEVGRFEANAQIQVLRPVYGTSYETILLNYLDRDFIFEYVEGQLMDYQEGQYINNLTSLLAFYTYIALGIDYDSFSKFGGKEFYLKANNIATNAQQSGFKGWQIFDGVNSRAALLENLMNQQLEPFREGLYLYCRKGLDIFAQNQESQTIARKNAIEFFKNIQTCFNLKPTSILLKGFLDTKAREFTQMFEKAQPDEKQMAYNILNQMDPEHSEIYQKLVK